MESLPLDHELRSHAIGKAGGRAHVLQCRGRREESSELAALFGHPSRPKCPSEAQEKREAENDDS